MFRCPKFVTVDLVGSKRASSCGPCELGLERKI